MAPSLFYSQLAWRGSGTAALEGEGASKLAVAARCGNVAVARDLLARGADVHGRGANGWTALHEAVHGQNCAMAALLLQHGAEINTRASGNKGETSLMLACGASDGLEMVRMMLHQVGVDPLLVNAHDRTVLQQAWHDDRLAVLGVLLRRKCSQTRQPPTDADSEWLLPEVFYARSCWLSADVHALEHGDSTKLSIAAESGNVAMARDLLGLGAEVNQAGHAGWTALHAASRSGKIAMAALLLKAGADVNARSSVPGSRTPLMAALQLAKPTQMVRFLLHAQGLDLTVKDENGSDACQRCIELGHSAVAGMLRVKLRATTLPTPGDAQSYARAVTVNPKQSLRDK